MSFSNQKSFKKGAIGEEFVETFLIQKGFVIYAPINQNTAHAFDRLCVTPNKRLARIAEVKTKPARIKYPDTGIDFQDYEEYRYMMATYNLDTYLYFVDENSETIYGNLLSILEQKRQIRANDRILSYPMTFGGIIYFPIAAMETIAKLPRDVVTTIQEQSNINPKYEFVF